MTHLILRFLAFGLTCFLAALLHAQTPSAIGGKGLDLDGDGMSDLWEAFHSVGQGGPQFDSDKDGRSDLDEYLSGTNPNDPNEYFFLQSFTTEPTLTQYTLTWPSVLDKYYAVEYSTGLKQWTSVGEDIPGTGAVIRSSFTLENPGASRFFRIKVKDVDADNDGLLAFEERLLGFSDTDRNSDSSSQTDYERAMRMMTGSTPFLLNGKRVQPVSPSLEEASRFLVQATLGADYELIERVSRLGFPSWLDEQFALPPTYYLPVNLQLGLPEEDDPEAPPFSPFVWAWWTVNMNAEDLLRHRIAYALSQILVVSDVGSDLLRDTPWALAIYYDLLVKHAFGNYRDLLYDVSMNPVMGHFLTHEKNRKADPATNRFPDENYARELMQLFTIGLYELNQDGTRKQVNGQDIPTYTNQDIREFARVFTGITNSPEPPVPGVPYYGDLDDIMEVVTEEDFLNTNDDFLGVPMMTFEPLHDTDPKQLLSYQTVNGAMVTGSLPANQTAEQDIRNAIDNLFHHPNVGPFIGRLLIQRLTKSNPSPEYISRVAAAFNDNGSGVRGDMKSVIRAILLDPEARNRGYLNEPTNGMLREPYIRHMHLCRAFNVTTQSGVFRIEFEYPKESFKQQPLSAPSVFNFYQPDHAPLGVIKDSGLVAPEFQITTATTSVAAMNLWATWILSGTFIEAVSGPGIEDSAEASLDQETELYDDPVALVERLDLILTYGSMTQTAKGIIIQALTDASANPMLDDWDIVLIGIYLTAVSPDFAVLK